MTMQEIESRFNELSNEELIDAMYEIAMIADKSITDKKTIFQIKNMLKKRIGGQNK